MDKKHKLSSSNVTNDSDASGETNSLSAESTTENMTQLHPRKIGHRRDSEWEVVEGLKEGQRFEKKPEICSGFLHKKRKWPLKGWHKRFFVLDKGTLVYGKNPSEINKGKVHGSVDIGLSVISSKLNGHRIDIDAEEFIYHLKAKTEDNFVKWLQQLKEHRLYRQHALTYGSKMGLLSSNHHNESTVDSPKIITKSVLTAGLKTTEDPHDRLSSWLKNVRLPLDQIQRDITLTEKNFKQLSDLLEQIEPKKGSSDYESNSLMGFRNMDLYSTNIEVNTVEVCQLSSEALDSRLYESFYVVAKEVFNNLKSIVTLMSTEQERLNKILSEENQSIPNFSTNADLIAGLKNSLKEALQQNNELRRRLKCIHDTSDSSNLSHLETRIKVQHSNHSSLSCDSSGVSASEFFDAEDLPDDDQEKTEVPAIDLEGQISTRGSDTSSEAESFSSNDSVSSESELETEYSRTSNQMIIEGGQGLTGRRTILPTSRPATEGLSLWNLLYKNIGKDLSQISMPVALNEPLNILQRLCEELEYSELLDKAAELEDPYERMVYVAAFAVSAYASSYSRAGNKPFNPLLGETYECIREDKGFRFLAEQVSHHPPISACYAESRNFIFWQEARVKTKFWGKSMEFQPLGKVHLLLPRTGDTYSWNKVTTCVHNLFSGQRWVDQYGELHITNEHISCKLTFAKTSYWSSKRHEVLGTVYDESGKSVRKLFGKWSEALYCGVAPSARCIWRAGTLPPNHEQYYGFTRFAIELNELGPDYDLLPPTDTRFRPDQRALENGDLAKAEQLKSHLENAQRERRKQRSIENRNYQPQWFCRPPNAKDGDEWQYNGKYWDIRKNLGFADLSLEPLW
ncbi:hypothetical protein ILUMI_13710 [Ignelater luminosus]|uniref:Oxysterol-binding protein n=1 Tax=Ignelater luminosus TaxID=2038154 RepID=A0A8K0CVR5_IGNLU|nr:hypothetical protein ILUMI_13710 [Ignelater luminosus]